MALKAKALQDFKIIILRDYGVSLSDGQAQDFGMSLLHLTRLAFTVSLSEEEKTKNQFIS